MAAEQAKEYLGKVRSAYQVCQQYLYKLHELKTSSKKLIAAYEMAPGGGRRSDISDKIAQIDEMQHLMLQKWNGWSAANREVSSFIDELAIDEHIRTVLVMRYIDFCKWDDIAEAQHIGIRQVQRWHGIGLQAAEAKLTAMTLSNPAAVL